MSAAVKTPTRPLVIAVTALLAGFACDRSPTAVLTSPLLTARSNPPAPSPSTGAHTGLVTCLQTYDSVTQAIGPTGGVIAVGHHSLWVDSLALTSTVTITAVAPSDTVRWVRFHPDGLIFQTKTKTGYPAIISPTTRAAECRRVTRSGSLRSAIHGASSGTCKRT